MKGNVTAIGASNEFNPVLSFNIEIESDKNKRIVFVNILSKVSTTRPMNLSIDLGRLIPREAFMNIGARESGSFTFDLSLDRKRLNDIEGARKKDVWFDIYMRTLFIEVENWSPTKFGWEGFHLGKERYTDKVRIPESDWLKLRDELGYGKVRIVEVTEETYKRLERFRSEYRYRDLDEAIHEAILLGRSKKEA